MNLKLRNRLLTIAAIACVSMNSYAQKDRDESQEQVRSTQDSQDSAFANVPQTTNHSLGVAIGQTVLIGKYADFGGDDLSFDLYYHYRASQSFDFIANFHYASFEKKQTEISSTGFAPGIRAKLFQFDSFAPYVGGGFGLYRPVTTRLLANGESVESDPKWTLGTHLFAGAELKLNDHIAFGLMAHYHNPFDVDQDSGPQIEGAYLKMLATTTYTF